VTPLESWLAQVEARLKAAVKVISAAQRVAERLREVATCCRSWSRLSNHDDSCPLAAEETKT